MPATDIEPAVTISDAGPCRKKLSIEIPAEAVEEKLRESLDTIAVEAALPGFRRGRAPRSLIEKRFGSTIRQEARNQLIASAYSRAVEDNKLKVIGDPIDKGLKDLKLEDGKPLAFELEVEILPEFDLPALEGIAIMRPTIDVTEDMVKREVERLCINEGTLEERQTPQPGDYLTGHGIMTGPEGVEFYNIKGAVIQVPTPDKAGKGMILGVMVEDFEKQLGSPKIGETTTIRAKGPANHEVEAIRGADLTITFKIDRADRIVPAKAEELVSRYGLENEQALHDALKRRLQQRALIEQQAAMRQQIAHHLVKNTNFEVPPKLTADQAARNLERRRMELMYRGMEASKIEEEIARLRAVTGQAAVRDLKLFFIMAKAAEELKVRVDEGDLNGRISLMAAERGVRPERLRQELAQHNRLGMLFQQIREHKTMDAMLAKASVTEVPLDQFNQAMRGEN